MRHNFTARDWKRWRTGLLVLPVVYLSGLAMYWSLQYFRLRIEVAEATANQALVDNEMAIERRDLDESRRTGDRLETHFNELRTLLRLVIVLSLVGIFVVVVFIWAGWLITSCPSGIVEKTSRWLLFLLPIVVLRPLLAGNQPLITLLSQGIMLLVATGQHNALVKICRVTENEELEVKLARFPTYLLVFFVVMILLIPLLEILGIRQPLLPMLLMSIYLFSTWYVCYLSLIVWRIRDQMSASI